MKLIGRCSWCSRLLFLIFGEVSPGGTMHRRCAELVEHIVAEDQRRMEPWSES